MLPIYLNRALEQGIIDSRKHGRLGIPIPSLHTWLTDDYGIGAHTCQQASTHLVRQKILKNPSDLKPDPQWNDDPQITLCL